MVEDFARTFSLQWWEQKANYDKLKSNEIKKIETIIVHYSFKEFTCREEMGLVTRGECRL